MSKLRHKVFQIILMVIVVILARRLPCSANNLNKYEKALMPWFRGERPMESLAPSVCNDPSALFEQLDRDTPAKEPKDFSKWHNLLDMVKIDNTQQLSQTKEQDDINKADDVEQEQEQEQELLLPLPMSAASNYARQQGQRQRYFERLQNEAADREFEQMMMKLKSKLQQERARNNGIPMKSVAKKDQHKNFLDNADIFCKKSNSTKKCKKPKLTTTTEYSTTITTTAVSSTTLPPIPATKPSKCKPKNMPKEEYKPEDLDHLLITVLAMKKHALLILKNLDLLEMELLNRDSCAPSDEARTTPAAALDSTGSTESTHAHESKTHERLDKPTTPTPFMFNRSFYLGLRSPEERERDMNMETAMSEQQKLEEKIREEYQMQRDLMRSESLRLLLQRLQSKSKRARFEAAPAAAVRLELMTTPSTNIVGNTKVNQKIPHAKQSSAAVNSVAKKIRAYANRNHIDLACQPFHSWKMMRKFKRKSKTNIIAPVIPEGFPVTADKKIVSETCVRPRMQHVQRQQRRHSRIRQQLPLNNHRPTSS